LRGGVCLRDDRTIRVVTPADVASVRARLLTYVFGSSAVPSATATVTPNVASHPLPALPPNSARVDRFDIVMMNGQTSVAYLYLAQRKNGSVVIYNPGHACRIDDGVANNDVGFGDQRTIEALLFEGFAVLVTYMPGYEHTQDCTGHDNFRFLPVDSGHPLRFFLEPVAIGINTLVATYRELRTEYAFVGLSGGGWTGTVYAALDPRVKVTISVAGTMPLYLRDGGSIGDWEQYESSFYEIAGYPELYVLGSYGNDRRHIQILNRREDCCVSSDPAQWTASMQAAYGDWQDNVREYERSVRVTLYNLAAPNPSGFFRVEIDEAGGHTGVPRNHGISRNAIHNIIIPELRDGRRPVGAASTNHVGARGMDGNLYLWEAGVGWSTSGFPMTGVPAIVEGGPNGFDILYRDASGVLAHAWKTGRDWNRQFLGGHIMTDPVAVRYKTSVYVAALGSDYRAYFWTLQPGYNLVSASPELVGQPAFTVDGESLNLFARDVQSRAIHVLRSGIPPTSGSWVLGIVGGQTTGFPAATQVGTRTRLYVVGVNSNHLWEATRGYPDPWIWTDLSSESKSLADVTGSPSVVVQDGGIHVDGRLTDGALAQFTKSGSMWTFSSVATTLSGSPVTVPAPTGAATFVRGESGKTWLHDAAGWRDLGGLIYP